MRLSKFSVFLFFFKERELTECLARYCVRSVSVSVLRTNSGVVLGTCDDETSAELTISETGQHAN